MATFLFNEIIFGPIKSRRLGTSLGVNLLPENYKYCNFNCLYCECGWTLSDSSKIKLHSKEEITEALEKKLIEMKKENNIPDNITFAGNGEPTIHPDFEAIIDNTIELRNKYFPNAKISVLSNATLIHKQNVINALLKVDQNILKLDSAVEKTYQILNQPKSKTTIETVVKRMMDFHGNLSIQTIFIKGNYKGQYFDNTTNEEVDAWIEILKKIKPKMVMIYPIDRDTPHSDLEKISKEKLNEIGEKVRLAGFEISVSN